MSWRHVALVGVLAAASLGALALDARDAGMALAGAAAASVPALIAKNGEKKS